MAHLQSQVAHAVFRQSIEYLHQLLLVVGPQQSVRFVKHLRFTADSFVTVCDRSRTFDAYM